MSTDELALQPVYTVHTELLALNRDRPSPHGEISKTTTPNPIWLNVICVCLGVLGIASMFTGFVWKLLSSRADGITLGLFVGGASVFLITVSCLVRNRKRQV
jgi:hypothetical protein